MGAQAVTKPGYDVVETFTMSADKSFTQFLAALIKPGYKLVAVEHIGLTAKAYFKKNTFKSKLMATKVLAFFITVGILLSSTVAQAEAFTFIKNGTYHIITLENFNEDQLPHQLDQIRQPGDIGCMYLNEETNTHFFVLIHKQTLPEFNKGGSFGQVNVKMLVKQLTTYNGLAIYEFVKWSN